MNLKFLAVVVVLIIVYLGVSNGESEIIIESLILVIL